MIEDKYIFNSTIYFEDGLFFEEYKYEILMKKFDYFLYILELKKDSEYSILMKKNKFLFGSFNFKRSNITDDLIIKNLIDIINDSIFIFKPKDEIKILIKEI